MADTPDIQAALAALKEGFAKKIPAKVEEIRQGWERLKSTPQDRDMFQLLHRQTHNLAGTAATYGFNEISRLVKAVEIALQTVLTQEHQTWTGIEMDKLELLLVQLEELAQEEPGKQESGFAELQLKPIAGAPHNDNRLIYLVDDDSDYLSAISMQIRTFGYEVETFSDLIAFDEAINNQSPAVVIMDVMFGEGEKAGIEQIARINAGREQPLQTIFISGSDDVPTRLGAVRASGAAYFPKPVRVEQLVDALDGLTQQHEEEPYNVIIVDDSEEQSAFAALHLQQAGMETQQVNDPLQLLHLLAEFPADLVLMDIYMPDCSGLELSRVIRQMEAYVSLPIVFLSSEHDLKKQLGAMQLGGDDFLSKPVQPWHLVSVVRSRARRGRMMRKLADTDGLTGLLNHSKSKERLEIELARARREKSPLSFAMLDIDHFKHVNDSYGHPAGDRVLKSLANMFKQRLRQYDTVGRYGGEEFVVILPHTDAATAKVIMDKLRVSFSEINHFSEKGDFHCRFSCGIASFPEIANGTTLNNAADKALYEAKEGGRNRVVIAAGHAAGE